MTFEEWAKDQPAIKTGRVNSWAFANSREIFNAGVLAERARCKQACIDIGQTVGSNQQTALACAQLIDKAA